jgi:hypothetical protein
LPFNTKAVIEHVEGGGFELVVGLPV